MDALPTQEEYAVRLEVFEGPLDLLLYLIKKDEVDIYDIPISSIAAQYMEYIGVMRMLDLNIAGDFLVMAATLMMIKSRMLLPVDSRPDEEEEDGEDPRWDLVRQLVAYKKFKDAALHLENLEESQLNVLEPAASEVDFGPEPGLALRDVSLFDLINTFQQILARAPREDLREIMVEKFTVAEKIDDLMKLVNRKGSRVSLSALFQAMTSRKEMICTFLALLELIKQKLIRAVQDGDFGDILILADQEEEAELFTASNPSQNDLADVSPLPPADVQAEDFMFNDQQFEEEMSTTELELLEERTHILIPPSSDIPVAYDDDEEDEEDFDDEEEEDEDDFEDEDEDEDLDDEDFDDEELDDEELDDEEVEEDDLDDEEELDDDDLDEELDDEDFDDEDFDDEDDDEDYDDEEDDEEDED